MLGIVYALVVLGERTGDVGTFVNGAAMFSFIYAAALLITGSARKIGFLSDGSSTQSAVLNAPANAMGTATSVSAGGSRGKPTRAKSSRAIGHSKNPYSQRRRRTEMGQWGTSRTGTTQRDIIPETPPRRRRRAKERDTWW
jgi:hypothetical protein